MPVFVLDDALLRGRNAGAARIAFMLASLAELAAGLAARGAPLVVRHGRPADVIAALAAEVDASDVYVSRDVGPYARARDRAVAAALAADGRTLHARPGLVVVEPDALARAPAVRTPSSRRTRGGGWGRPAASRCPRPGGSPAIRRSGPTAPGPSRRPRTSASALPPLVDAPAPGETAARARLDRWVASGLDGYAERRDTLAAPGTSRLSQDLRWGLLSPVEVLDRAAGEGDGRRAFATELAWRDFYAAVLHHFPHAARGAFRPAYGRRPVARRPLRPRRLARGADRLPVVDAAMRQLAATGWMHNRARMIVASFLAKDLLLDWRRGSGTSWAACSTATSRATTAAGSGRPDGDRRAAVLPDLQPGRPG